MTTDDYNIQIDKGISLVKDGNYGKAIKYFEKAHAIKPNGLDAIRHKAASLAKIGNHDEAIKWFDKALEIIPVDSSLLRSDLLQRKGVSLASEGEHDEAIKCCDEALAINPSDPNALRYKGISLATKGDQNEAIKCLLKSISLDKKKKDSQSMRALAASLLSEGKQDEALQRINEALDIEPNDPISNLILMIIEFEMRNLTKAIQAYKKARENWDPVGQKNHDILRADSFFRSCCPKIFEKEKIPLINGRSKEYKRSGFLGGLRKIQISEAEIIDGFFAKKKETSDRLNECILGPSLLKNDRSLFLTLRKWNSYTPIILKKKHERSVGGGYFIFHKGKGTIIDPGYNFIDNFFRAGGRIVDIENIVLTHAHDDHTSNFEPLLSLIYQYNKEKKLQIEAESYKRINIYANVGSFKKFCTILDLKEDYIKMAYVISPKLKFRIDDDLVMEALVAYHDETITKKYALGLKFVFGKGANRKTMLFTSDTGLLPNSSKDKKLNEMPEIWETYPRSDDINVLIVHLGSIKRREFKYTPVSTFEDVLYANHLGYIGTVRVINKVGPKLAIISEFGEEVSDFQEPLVDLITKAINWLCDKERKHKPKVLPADLPLIYDIFSEQIYCIYTKKMVEVSKIEFTLPSPTTDKMFYYRNGEEKKIDNIGEKANEFEKELAERRGLYFKTEIDTRSHY